MNNELSQIKSEIKSGNLSEFTSVLKKSSPEARLDTKVFNLLCEPNKYFNNVPLGVDEFAKIFANHNPNYYFSHLSRLCYNNFDFIEHLIFKDLYSQYQNQHSKPIVKHLKLAFFKSKNREPFLDLLDDVDFENNEILKVIDELNSLYNIQAGFKDEVYFSKNLNKYSWDITLFTLTAFLEIKQCNLHSQSTVEKIVNLKSVDYSFAGSYEDYIVFLTSMLFSNKNESVLFCGKKLESSDIRINVNKLLALFEEIYQLSQLEQIVESYCLEDNLSILEMEDGSYKFSYLSDETESEFQKANIKYQIFSSYFDVKAQEDVNSANRVLNDAEQIKMNVDKCLRWFDENGVKNATLSERLFQYLSLFAHHSKMRFSSSHEAVTQEEVFNVLFNKLNHPEITIGGGIPFYCKSVSNHKKGIIQAAISIFNDRGFINEIDLQFDAVNFKKSDIETNEKDRFTFRKHLHFELHGKVFAFRSVLNQQELSHFAYNKKIDIDKANFDSSFFEQTIRDSLLKSSFKVIDKEDTLELKKESKIEFDVLAYNDGVVFSFEVKSTSFRQLLIDNHQHIERDLMKAAYQLDKNLSFIKENPKVIAEYFKVDVDQIKTSQIKTYIVSTTFEKDHMEIGGHLKISHFELLRLLGNEKDHLVPPFLMSHNHYTQLYSSNLTHELVDNEERVINSFINNDKIFLSAKELIYNLDNNKFWSLFLDGIPCTAGSFSVKDCKITSNGFFGYKVPAINKKKVDSLLGIACI